MWRGYWAAVSPPLPPGCNEVISFVLTCVLCHDVTTEQGWQGQLIIDWNLWKTQSKRNLSRCLCQASFLFFRVTEFWLTHSANWFSTQLSCTRTQEYSVINHTEKRKQILISHHRWKSLENNQRRGCKTWSYELILYMCNSSVQWPRQKVFLT